MPSTRVQCTHMYFYLIHFFLYNFQLQRKVIKFYIYMLGLDSVYTVHTKHMKKKNLIKIFLKLYYVEFFNKVCILEIIVVALARYEKTSVLQQCVFVYFYLLQQIQLACVFFNFQKRFAITANLTCAKVKKRI